MKTREMMYAAELFGASGVPVPADWDPCALITVWKGEDGYWHVDPELDEEMVPRSDSDAAKLFAEAEPKYDLEVRFSEDDDWEHLMAVSCPEVATAEVVEGCFLAHMDNPPPKYPFRLTPIEGGGGDEALYYSLVKGRWIDAGLAI